MIAITTSSSIRVKARRRMPLFIRSPSRRLTTETRRHREPVNGDRSHRTDGTLFVALTPVPSVSRCLCGDLVFWARSVRSLRFAAARAAVCGGFALDPVALHVVQREVPVRHLLRRGGDVVADERAAE